MNNKSLAQFRRAFGTLPNHARFFIGKTRGNRVCRCAAGAFSTRSNTDNEFKRRQNGEHSANENRRDGPAVGPSWPLAMVAKISKRKP